MEIFEDEIYFEDDNEFTDFCIKPYGEIIRMDGGGLAYVGIYTPQYTKCLEEGKSFIIKDRNSQVADRCCVCKRVPIRGTGKRTDPVRLVQMQVKNLEYFDSMLYDKLKK